MQEPRPYTQIDDPEGVFVRWWRRLRGIDNWLQVSSILKVRRYIPDDEGGKGRYELDLTYKDSNDETVWVTLTDYENFYFWVLPDEKIPLLVNPRRRKQAVFDHPEPAASIIKMNLFIGILVLFLLCGWAYKFWEWFMRY